MDTPADPQPADDLRLDDQVGHTVVQAARNVVSVYRPILEPLGLTHPQYVVMLALWEASPRSLGELAERVAVEPASLSPLVKRLQAQGLVTRERDGVDERVLRIGLSEAGRALRSRAAEVPAKVRAATGLGAADVAALRERLRPFAVLR